MKQTAAAEMVCEPLKVASQMAGDALAPFPTRRPSLVHSEAFVLSLFGAFCVKTLRPKIRKSFTASECVCNTRLIQVQKHGAFSRQRLHKNTTQTQSNNTSTLFFITPENAHHEEPEASLQLFVFLKNAARFFQFQ